MTGTPRGRFTATLLRAGYLAAALAIIAGIFGMHIMTGAHVMPPGLGMTVTGGATTIETAAMPASHSPAAGTHSPAAGTPTGEAAMDPQVTGSASPSCAPAGSCPEMSAGAAACILAPANPTLTVPMPGTAPYELPHFAATAAVSSTYSYSPGSPSPGDLCISRT